MFNNLKNINVYIDMDGTLTKFMYVVLSVLYTAGYFLNLPPHANVVTAVKMLTKMGVKVTVLSCYLADHPTAYEEKLLPCGEEKTQTVKERLGRNLTSSDILLDDHSPNVISWCRNGGRGVKLLNAVNGKGIKWHGETVHYMDAPEKIVSTIVGVDSASFENIA